MDKELHQTLANVTMYSKMGRYISNKILKYNKSTKTHRVQRRSQPHENDYKHIRKNKQFNSLSHSSHSFNRTKTEINAMQSLVQPPVGYYKISYAQVQKNPKTYNFNRSVPHFNRQKYFCHQSQTVFNNLPESQLCHPRATGLAQLKRMAGRADIKGSIRKQIEDPHENRFKMIKDLKSIQFSGTRVNMAKDLPRNNMLFKSDEFSPQYDYSLGNVHRRLDTHIIPFERTVPRNEEALNCKTGISQCFNQNEYKLDLKSICWKKMLSRQKTGIMPSYMDKNINTRASIDQLNLKTLEMNCSDIRKPVLKTKKQKKMAMFMQESVQQDKQNNIASNFVY